MSDPGRAVPGRVWVSCPGCDEKYVLEEARIPAQGGSLTCRICGSRIPVQRPPEPVSREGAGEAASAAPPHGSLEGTHAAAGSPPDRTGSGAIVCCPRCGFSFEPQATAGAPSATAGERRTVLIVEDTEFFLNLACETLQPGYDTLCARSAAEALSLLRDHRVDLVVLDLTLEREDDGLDVLAAAARQGLPCLVFTAKSETEMWGESWQRLRKKGATDLLLKGMNIEEQLLSKINSLLTPH